MKMPDAVTVALIATALLCSALLVIAYHSTRFDGERIAHDVHLAGHPLGGRTSAQMKDLLEKAAHKVQHPPTDSYKNVEEDYIVPARWGWRLNVDLLHSRLLEAPSGSRLHPVWDIVPPQDCTPDPGRLPVRAAAPGCNAVGLMVNVAWGGEYIPQLLKVLEQHEGEATFFVLGTWAEDNLEILDQLIESGHRVAAHGFADRHPGQMTRAEFRDDLKRSVELLTQRCGYPPTLYTPHYGEIKDFTIKEAHQQGLMTVLWTTDTADWLLDDPDEMMQRVMSDVRDGSLVLMHPTDNTAAFLRRFLTYLQTRGLKAKSCEHLLQPLPPTPRNMLRALEKLDR